MKISLFVSSLVLASIYLFSDSYGTVTGSISLEGGTEVTDAEGYYPANIPGGIYQVKFSKQGFQSLYDQKGAKVAIGEYINIVVGANGCSTESIKIFDVVGLAVPFRLTASGMSQEGDMRLDISSFPPGVYFVLVGNKLSKFVKVK